MLNDKIILYSGIGLITMEYAYCTYKTLKNKKSNERKIELRKMYLELPREQVKNKMFLRSIENIEDMIFDEVVSDIGKYSNKELFSKLRLICDLQIKKEMKHAFECGIDENTTVGEVNQYIIEIMEHVRTVTEVLTSVKVEEHIFHQSVMEEIENAKKYFK